MSELQQGSSPEYVEFPQDPTLGDIATFQDEEQRELDFKEFMMGDAHMPGGRHDLKQRGLSTDDIPARTDALIDPFSQSLTPEDDYVQQGAQPSPQPQEQDWKKEYGKSENEKGELRNQLTAAMNELVTLRQVHEAGSVQLPSFFDTPQAQPAQQAPQQPVPQPAFDPRSMPRIVDKADGEPMFAEDVEAILREKVAPIFFDMQQQLTTAHAQAATTNQRMFDVEKARLGITPQVERVFVAQNPWLQGMRDPSAYLQALGQIKAREDAALQTQATAAPAPASPTQPISPNQRQAVRHRTFVESSSQAAGPPQANSLTADPNALFAQAWAETLALPFEKRGEAQRKLLKARGVRQVSGYRDPTVLTS